MPVPAPPSAAEIAGFRRFNRRYTRLLGTLDANYLGTGFSLAEGRVLYELTERANARATDVGEALGLDAGYLSRILRRFERTGLISRVAAKRDRRATYLRLTVRGRGVIRQLNQRADRQARGILGSLSAGQRARLALAWGTMEQAVLGGGTPPAAPALRAHRPGDMGMVVALEGAGYAAQFGWDPNFEALVARIVADFLAHFDPVRERCWIAERGGEHLGHVFLVRHPERPDTAKLRLLYVDPAARGLGLGRTLVAECVAFARAVGYKKLTLWTQSMLISAGRIYAAAGFRLVAEEPHRSFGHELVAQTWELDLDQPNARLG